MNTIQEHGTTRQVPETQADESTLFLGSPCHTVCPYDVYARYIVEDGEKAFRRAKIPVRIQTCSRWKTSVVFGTGPGGSVRFGDAHMPPEVVAVVQTADLERASAAWEAYTFRKCLTRKHPISLGKYWNGAAWIQGNTWGRVAENALEIARRLGKPLDKLTAYTTKHPVKP